MKGTSEKNAREAQKELDDYLSVKKAHKSYLASMKEISSWLLKKEKKFQQFFNY